MVRNMSSPASSADDLNALVEACLADDEKGKNMLYNRYASPMYAVCLRYLRNEDDARDVLHDGFIKVLSNLSTFRGTGPFEAWMRRIFVNASLEMLRRRKIRFMESEGDEPIEIPVAPAAVSSMGVKEIMKAVQELADGYRTVFNLYVMEGFSHAEIGDMLGISEQTSKSQLSRARAILQKKLTRH